MDIFLRGITVYHWNQFSSLKMILSRKSYLFHSILFFSISSYCELNIANHEQSFKGLGLSLREKCPNPEFFLARIFQENTDQEKLHIWTLSTQWLIFLKHSIILSFTTKFQTSLIISALSVMGEECSFTINKRLILTLRKIDLTVYVTAARSESTTT